MIAGELIDFDAPHDEQTRRIRCAATLVKAVWIMQESMLDGARTARQVWIESSTGAVHETVEPLPCLPRSRA